MLTEGDKGTKIAILFKISAQLSSFFSVGQVAVGRGSFWAANRTHEEKEEIEDASSI